MRSDKSTPQAWYQEGVGIRLIEAEKEELSNLLPKLYGYHLVSLGDPGLAFLAGSSLISHRIMVNPQAGTNSRNMSQLTGALEAIPIRSDSVDVVVLSHTLEQVANPHEVLRETHRILIAEGHVVITGFNPYSLWGAWHFHKRFTGKSPRQGKMLSINRVRDWLKLLNFQIVGGRMFYFRPPVYHYGVYQKLRFLEKWGENCWPFFGGAYTLIAVKRVIPLTPIRAKKKLEKLLWQPVEGLPKPTTTVRNKIK